MEALHFNSPLRIAVIYATKFSDNGNIDACLIKQDIVN